ncbi:hypothetical protein Micbo1qcDRAFT_218158 [Microdochium bolleyi]|uniref:FAD-binding PCMH-type domain-containing protein n=1 Tax=Microdochium bolleyi TaxID=196109 RepID=A0A136JGH3_9PEZI|nr:hypothetical protein Micbo1qcDRAFT_218158 [Microdochium bolleyi]
MATSHEQSRDGNPSLEPLLKAHPNLQLYLPSQPEYEDSRHIFNRDSTATPLAVVRPRDEDDLVDTAKFCSEHGIPMTIRSGGHDLQMRTSLDGAVMLDVRALSSVRVDTNDASGQRYAVIGGGATSLHVLEELDKQGLITPTGWCLEVGYVGWAAGGGYGLMASSHGMGADQILGARVLTPGGTVVDTKDDSELLWAIRGAGLGNFGVILEIRVKVYPRPRVLAGILAYPFTEVEKVLGGFEEMCQQDLPRELAAEGAFANAGPGPSIALYFHWILDGTEENAARAELHLAKYRALGTVLLDTVAQTTSFELFKVMHAMMSPAAIHYVHSLSVRGFSADLIDVIAAHPPPSGSACVIHHGHGAVLDRNDAAVFSMRKERHLVFGISARLDPAVTDDVEIEQIRAWPQNLSTNIREKGLALEQSYWSFARNEVCDAKVFYGKEGVHRLMRVKEKYNPRDAFPASYPVLKA